MRRKLQAFVLSSLLSLLGLAWPQPAHGQDLGSVRISTVYATPFAPGTACTGSVQSAQIPNNGQTGHYLSYVTTGNPSSISVFMLGQFTATSSNFVISDIAKQTPIGQLQANGNYPIMLVGVNCPIGSTFGVFYTGQGIPTGAPAGTNLQSQIAKLLLTAAPLNTTASLPSVQTPYGSSGGALLFAANGTIPGGSTLSLTCDLVSGLNIPFFQSSFAIPAVTNGTFYFPVAPMPCVQPTLIFNSGGASAGTFNLVYDFFAPGFSSPPFQASHITGIAATAVKATGGLLHTLSINTGAAGTISLFDLPAASCTGTPGTNTIAVITATATTSESFIYDTNFVQGICVKASVAMDLTVAYE